MMYENALHANDLIDYIDYGKSDDIFLATK